MKMLLQQERNEIARKEIETINREMGVNFKHLGDRLNLCPSSFTQWRKGLYMFGENRLKQAESLIAKYKKFSEEG